MLMQILQLHEHNTSHHVSLLKPQQHLILCIPDKQKRNSSNTDFPALCENGKLQCSVFFELTEPVFHSSNLHLNTFSLKFSVCDCSVFIYRNCTGGYFFAISTRPLTLALSGQTVNVGGLHLLLFCSDLIDDLWEMCYYFTKQTTMTRKIGANYLYVFRLCS